MPTLPRDQLILRLNEVYHDLENRAYDGKHPDISETEVERWRRIGSSLLAGARADLDILDLGSGTGFVPLQLKEWLRKGDRLTCSDLSAGMLEACRSNLASAGVPCALHTLKLDGRGIGLPDRSQDLVTVNAVMHHLADPEAACREIHRILRPGGHVVIGHEPTLAYRERPALAWIYWCLLPLADWKLFGYEILLRLGLYNRLRGALGRVVPELRRHNQLVREVNASLIRSGDIDRPLEADAMSALLDAQSPTAGGVHPERGFSREGLSAMFPGYRLERYETYKHLDKIHPRAAWIRRFEERLAKRWPENGSSLFCVLEKPLRD
jgi:SAM-dependent methyltransferase